MNAEHLKIQVSRQGMIIASLTFPATAVENLGNLVPAPIAKKLLADGVDPEFIGRKAAASGFPKGDLFTNDDGQGKVVRVWME